MMNVANTIREQLGGNRFAIMTGAKNFAGDSNSLQFQIGRFAGLQIRYVRIELDVTDTYSMKFYNAKCEVIAERSNVHGDQLAPVFSAITGLDTRL